VWVLWKSTQGKSYFSCGNILNYIYRVVSLSVQTTPYAPNLAGTPPFLTPFIMIFPSGSKHYEFLSFHIGAAEVPVLLGYVTASLRHWFPTLGAEIVVPKRRPQIIHWRCVVSQKNGFHDFRLVPGILRRVSHGQFRLNYVQLYLASFAVLFNFM
jgi:hypothetical protein